MAGLLVYVSETDRSLLAFGVGCAGGIQRFLSNTAHEWCRAREMP